jgi:antitoxin component of MazEF toxin-antitoxin module
MTCVTVKHGDEPTLILPESELKALKLREGDQVSVSVRIVPRRSSPEDIEAFLALAGTLTDEEAKVFEKTMQYLDTLWEKWNHDLRASA